MNEHTIKTTLTVSFLMFLLENLKLCVSLAQSCYCKCFLHKCQQNLGTKGQSQMWYFLLKKEGKKWLLKVLIFPFFPSSLSTCHGFSYLILNIASPSAYTSVYEGTAGQKEMQTLITQLLCCPPAAGLCLLTGLVGHP